MRKPRHLRTQLSLAMILTALTGLIIFILGMAIFYTNLQNKWVDGLSPGNQQALNTLLENGDVDPDALATLVNAFSLSWSGDYANQELFAVLVFLLIAVSCAIIFGIVLAGRLSRPIEAVTRAAQQVAGGSFKPHVSRSSGQSMELENLLQSFNRMTSALESAERESIESSAAIAHELRTPLTVLKGRLQGIKDGAFDPGPDMIDALIGQVETLSRIIDGLGKLSRLSAGQFELEITSINLANEAQKVLTGMAPDLEKDGICLEHILLSAPVMADPVQIRQAIGALIDNVRRYAVNGKRIRIETRLENNKAMLRVSDWGPGIAEGDLLRVFDRWWRAESSRGRKSGGSGLGLSIVRAIARAHGGEAVAANREKETGAVFTITLPLSQPSVEIE
jgi:two-component system, OmpR family, sensor histidine kinase AdeS